MHIGRMQGSTEFEMARTVFLQEPHIHIEYYMVTTWSHLLRCGCATMYILNTAKSIQNTHELGQNAHTVQ